MSNRTYGSLWISRTRRPRWPINEVFNDNSRLRKPTHKHVYIYIYIYKRRTAVLVVAVDEPLIKWTPFNAIEVRVRDDWYVTWYSLRHDPCTALAYTRPLTAGWQECERHFSSRPLSYCRRLLTWRHRGKPMRHVKDGAKAVCERCAEQPIQVHSSCKQVLWDVAFVLISGPLFE